MLHNNIENYIILFSIIAILFILLSGDKKNLISLKSDFLDFFENNKWFWIAVAITTLLSYGFALTNYSVGVDNEAISSYVHGGVLLSQGRFGLSNFLGLIFDAFEFLPFWFDFLGLIILIIANIFWSVYFMRMSHGRLEKKYTIIFSCLSISYPVIAYLFIFMGSIYSIGFSLLFTGVALILFTSWLYDDRGVNSLHPLKSFYKVVAAIFFLAISIGIHEWTTALFLTGIFSGLLLEYICDDTGKIKTSFKFFLYTVIKIIIILALAVILKEILTLLYQKINGIVPSGYTSNYISWKVNTIVNDIPKFIKNLFMVFFNDFFKGKDINLWLAVFNYAIIIEILIAIYLSIKNKSIIPSLIVFCIIGSSLSLNIITGNAFLEARTYVHLGVPIAFTFMLLTYLVFCENLTSIRTVPRYLLLFIQKGMKIVVITAVVLVCLYQTKSLSELFYFEYLRYEADVRTAYNIMYEIEKQDGSLKKPVVFIGPFSGSANINMGYVIFEHDRWNIPDRMEYSNRIIGFIEQLGYNMEAVSSQSDLDKALYESQKMPSYPKEGSIRVFDNFVVVKFGTPVTSP